MAVNRDESADAEALVRRLHDEHASALVGWLRTRVQDPKDAEEVIAETLVKAWHRYDQFDPERGSERAWIFGIARNAANDHYRRQTRHLRLLDTNETLDPTSDNVSQLAEATVVRDALMELSEDHRRVIVEAYFGGRTTSEIAKRLGIPAGTVKSRLFYGLRHLRAALEERGILQ